MLFSRKDNRCVFLRETWGICLHRSFTVAALIKVAVLMVWWTGLTLQTASAQSSGGYTIKKSTIDSGGGTVTGGAYRLSGTVGQHDAGPVSGGDYIVTDGFWSPAAAIPCPVPDPDPSGALKTRFISIAPVLCPTSPGGVSALRVRLVSLHHVVPPYTGGASIPFTSFEGQVRWVGPPTQYVESSSNPTQFHAAPLQCTPHYQDWSTVGLLHVYGSAVVPSSVYEVENLAASCAGIEASCTAVSARLSVNTTRWGDVAPDYNPPSTTAQPDVNDIAALVSKFRSAANAPIKARALLAGDVVFGNITSLNVDFGFDHIAACVDGFRGKPYPYTIQTCP